MRILVISDIHANLTALETVLADAGHTDAVWCLGDLVGYGPDPNECVARVRALPNLICLLGNHDAATINQLNLDTFNPDARFSIEWMQQTLNAENLDYLSRLPTKHVTEQVTLAHGSPRSPVYEYILDNYMATENFAYFTTPFCFVGHTHLPVHFHLRDSQSLAKLTIPKANTSLTLQPRAILNPGSVGQPRDRDPRAAYAIFDPDQLTWEYRRVLYDIAAVQARMRRVGLPERHVLRLDIGW